MERVIYICLFLWNAPEQIDAHIHTHVQSSIEMSEYSAGLPFYARLCMRTFQCMCFKMATIILFFVSPIELIAGSFYVPLIKWITSSVFVAKQNSLSFCFLFSHFALLQPTEYKQWTVEKAKKNILSFLFKCFSFVWLAFPFLSFVHESIDKEKWRPNSDRVFVGRCLSSVHNKNNWKKWKSSGFGSKKTFINFEI